MSFWAMRMCHDQQARLHAQPPVDEPSAATESAQILVPGLRACRWECLRSPCRSRRAPPPSRESRQAAYGEGRAIGPWFRHYLASGTHAQGSLVRYTGTTSVRRRSLSDILGGGALSVGVLAGDVPRRASS